MPIIARFGITCFIVLVYACGCASAGGESAQRAVAASQPATVQAVTAATSQPSYLARRAISAPLIDGKLDDAAWSAAAWTSDLVNILGTDHPVPPFRTRCRMLWDDGHLYVAAELSDSDVRAAMRKRGDPLFKENCFEMFIDPDGDGRDYWEIEINALATIWDLRMSRPYRDGGRPIRGAGIPHLRAAAAVQGTLNDASDTDRGWTIEMAIPFADLGAAPPREKDSPCWRVNFARIHYTGNAPRTPHFASWSPIGEENYHRPDKFGCLRFKPE